MEETTAYVRLRSKPIGSHFSAYFPHGDAAAIDYAAAEFLPDGKRELGDLRIRKGDRVAMRTFLYVPDRRLRSMDSQSNRRTRGRKHSQIAK